MLETIAQLLLSLLIGSLIGAEREFREKSAGLRTITLVCLGSTLFTIFSGLFSSLQGDPSRVAAGIVTGIGFLGAGVILREKREVWGLTTAAIIWLVAALGIGIGIKQYQTVILATMAALIVIWGFPKFDLISKARDTYTYEVIAPLEDQRLEDILANFREAGLVLNRQTLAKKGTRVIITWQVYGKPESHQKMMEKLMMDPSIDEVNII
ncbi:MgtC family protein [uncultured archaeon]|nr:MgtC family protein [uncultured archaeon]